MPSPKKRSNRLAPLQRSLRNAALQYRPLFDGVLTTSGDLRGWKAFDAGLNGGILESMTAFSHRVAAPTLRAALALLSVFAAAGPANAVCMSSRPVRYLWIEVVSCSDTVLQEVSAYLLRPDRDSLDRDFDGETRRWAEEQVAQTPGVLIAARQLAFADSEAPFTVLEGSEFSTRTSDRIGEWRCPENTAERRYFLPTRKSTCSSLVGAGRIVVLEDFDCCDTGRSGSIACILEVGRLFESVKAAPTPRELARFGGLPH